MAKIDAMKLWGLNYRLIATVIASIAPDVTALGLEVKELFVLSEIDEYPYPAELAVRLSMPKPTVTVYLKRLEAAGLVRREIDSSDLRRHRLLLTAAGRRTMTRSQALLSEAFGARLARLSAPEQAELSSLLEKLMD
ncbi:MAG TPA: MarR family transcriptional regulator [Polyangiaceae bacterium]|nr:MarR family transcriptional regulator [Polyangiaceae bacterium]